MKKLILCAGAALTLSLLSACATTELDDKAERKEEKVFVTGSNLPKKDKSGVTVVSREALENVTQTGGVSTNASGR